MSNGKKIALGASAVAVALGVSLGATGMASAATTTPAPSSSSSASAETPGSTAARGDGVKEGSGGHGPRGVGADAEELATKLGVEEASVIDALQAARDTARTDAGSETGEAPDREAMKASLVTSLAGELGLDEATVQTAIDEVKAEKQAELSAAVQERLDSAVGDGSLTQVEADGAAKAVELGILGSGGRG